MAEVVLRQVTKSFGTLQVIPPLDLTIDDGEFVVLVGPSGCGKTTTLRMVAGLEDVTTGAVLLAGRDVTAVRPGLRNCAMVFQNYALYPHMTVRQNIAYGMSARGEPADQIARRVEEAVTMLGISDLLDRKPRQLSGGQRQRVAIGRAIVRHPDVFLFDEPLSNLDAKLRIEMRAEIKDLHRRLGTTAIYVTHDQVEAMTMADRVVVMNGGVIEQAAAPLTLYEQPANRFVAAFIGAPSMNFLDGRLEGSGDGTTIDLGAAGRVPLAPADAARLADRNAPEVVLGIRPEHMHGGEGTATLEVLPRTVEPLGPHKLVVGHAGGHALTAQVEPHFPAEVDQSCRIALHMDQAHLFDPQSGRRI